MWQWKKKKKIQQPRDNPKLENLAVMATLELNYLNRQACWVLSKIALDTIKNSWWGKRWLIKVALRSEHNACCMLRYKHPTWFFVSPFWQQSPSWIKQVWAFFQIGLKFCATSKIYVRVYIVCVFYFFVLFFSPISYLCKISTMDVTITNSRRNTVPFNTKILVTSI